MPCLKKLLNDIFKFPDSTLILEGDLRTISCALELLGDFAFISGL